MNRIDNYISTYSVSWAKRNLLPFLNNLQSKIRLIALAAFGSLVACYKLVSSCFKDRSITRLGSNHYNSRQNNLITNISSTDLLKKIFKMLDTKDLLALSLVDRAFHEHEELWKSLCEKDFSFSDFNHSHPALTKSQRTWKLTYEFLNKTPITLNYLDGRKATGVIKKGQLEREGEIIYLDGTRRRGKFKKGELIQGKIISNDGRRIEEGTCVNGQLHGPVTVTLIETDNSYVKRYVTYDKGKISQGSYIKTVYSTGEVEEEGISYKVTYPDKTIYEGDKDTYEGKLIHPDGKIEEGEFTALHLPGLGFYHIISNFKSLKLNGKGKITYSDGKTEEGEFGDGKLNGPQIDLSKVDLNGVLCINFYTYDEWKKMTYGN